MHKLIKALLWLSLVATALIAVLRCAAIRWYQLPTNDPYLEASVAPTLRGGDWIILWRLTEPGYGNLVLCPEPNYPERIVIGRLIGEGGDELSITREGISVNNRNLAIERLCSDRDFKVTDPATGGEVEQVCHYEEVGSVLHMRGAPRGRWSSQREVHVKVPEGRVFLVSDNREFPYDSRDYGSVERHTCKETVVFRLLGKGGWFDVDSRLTFIR